MREMHSNEEFNTLTDESYDAMAIFDSSALIELIQSSCENVPLFVGGASDFTTVMFKTCSVEMLYLETNFAREVVSRWVFMMKSKGTGVHVVKRRFMISDKP